MAVTSGTSFTTRWWLLGILSLYALLVLPTVDRQGVNWDEQTDLDIASTYVDSRYGLVYGSDDDLINTRLPMFCTSALLATLPGDPTILARWASVAVSLLTILGVYVYGRLAYDRAKGLAAAALVATSPYFLYFGKQGLSEGDAWIAAATIWCLVALARYRARPVVAHAAWAGLALGLALSAKISGLALVPVVLLAVFTRHRDESVAIGATRSRAGALYLLSAGFALWLAGNVVVSLGVYRHAGIALDLEASQPVARFLAGATLAVLSILWTRRHARTPIRGREGLVLIFLATGLCFFLIPPVHTTNPRILGALAAQFLRGGDGLDLFALASSALFHVETIVIKSSVGVGICLLLAVPLAYLRRFDHGATRILLLTIVCYGAFLIALPWTQTRYMMPLVGPLALLAVEAIFALWSWRRSAAITVGVLSGLLLIGDLVDSYPDFNLNGYRLLGERFLHGRPTVGYRSIVHTPSDGIAQSLRWLRDHAVPGDTVMMVYGETHITRRYMDDQGLRVISQIHEPIPLSEADWIVTSINYELAWTQTEGERSDEIYAYRYYDRDELERDFVRAFTVQRRYGLEVAAVWQRMERER